MRFAVKYLSQFIDKLPQNIALLSEQLINLGIELENITIDDGGDSILEVAVAPNRADLLSIIGIARELAVVNNTEFKLPNIQNNHPSIRSDQDALKVSILEPQACPKYLLRVIRDIDPKATTPFWMQQVLNNAGIDLMKPVVDIANYVMLELGQPLHAFDLDKISGEPKEIVIRYAADNEELLLLNNNTIVLSNQDLIIADPQKPLAIAGIMGGLDSAISNNTRNIVIECAYFEPITIRSASTRHNILSDSAQRFVRSIDPNLPDLAIWRFSNLLADIAGGQFNNIEININEKYLPMISEINLHQEQIKKVLGFYPAEQKIIDILQNLKMITLKTLSGWKVTIPSWRQDIKIQEDLIEEIARFIGYNNIDKQIISLPLIFKMPEVKGLNFHKELQYKNCLVNRGYNEVINYSFIDLELAETFYPHYRYYELKNPISKNMNIMRPGLFPGLLLSLIYNQHRQQTRVRLFELGKVFILDAKTNIVTENKKIACIVSGKLLEENWNNLNDPINFFNLKSDVIALLRQENNIYEEEVIFKPINHSGLHPQQSASINVNGTMVGIIGALHPELMQQYSIVELPLMFELDLGLISNSQLSKFVEISKFPSIRRDFSIVVDIVTSSEQIRKAVRDACGELLRKIIFFDVYNGDKLPDLKKSLAFGVILQHADRTLVEQEINNVISKIIINLEQIGAYLRT